MCNHVALDRTTAPAGVLGTAIFRYYIDGETTASIQFTPPMAAGVGFDDTQAPWGTKWIGKGAKDGAVRVCVCCTAASSLCSVLSCC